MEEMEEVEELEVGEVNVEVVERDVVVGLVVVEAAAE